MAAAEDKRGRLWLGGTGFAEGATAYRIELGTG